MELTREKNINNAHSRSEVVGLLGGSGHPPPEKFEKIDAIGAFYSDQVGHIILIIYIPPPLHLKILNRISAI